LELTWAALAVKLLEVCPAATVTLDGSVRLALLLASETRNPPAGAAPFRETVQGVLPGVLMVKLVQFKLLKAMDTGRDIAPEPPLEDRGVPSAVVAAVLVSWTEIGLLDGLAAIWNVASATGPSAITVLLNPTIRQVFPEQDRDFPAFVADVPATTVTPVISEEKVKDHWSPAG